MKINRDMAMAYTKKTLNYFFWNVHGFYNHMNNSELRLYLKRYMFVGLCETWDESENILYLDKLKSWLSGYSCFVKGGMRVSKYGRCSGGIVFYVKNDVIANGCYKEVAKYCKFGIFLLLITVL